MATALPVVITPFIDLSADLGVADRHYLLSDPNAEALAGQIGDLLGNRELRIEQGRRGRRWVEETMDVRRSVDRYAALYRELAEGSLAGHK
jgi:glycosyltransferase involved in cell wall biosynthesis